MSAREPFQSILNDLREATQTLANCAALGPLQKDGTRTMSHAYPHHTRLSFEPREEKLDAREKTISDLETALEKISGIAGDYGDGAPDDHYLAHILLDIEAIAKDALDEARGTHRKALEAMQKRQQP